MPPKKAKKKSSTSKESSKSSTSDELSLSETLTKLKLENDLLLKEVDITRDANARLRMTVNVQTKRIDELEELLGVNEKEQREFSFDMMQKHKSLEEELSTRISALEEENMDLKRRLQHLTESTMEEKKEWSSKSSKKDKDLSESNSKLKYMSSEFEDMLQDIMSKLQKKIKNVDPDTEGVFLSLTSDFTKAAAEMEANMREDLMKK